MGSVISVYIHEPADEITALCDGPAEVVKVYFFSQGMGTITLYDGTILITRMRVSDSMHGTLHIALPHIAYQLGYTFDGSFMLPENSDAEWGVRLSVVVL